MDIERVVERINFLYKKSQQEGLNVEEKEEQQRLRKIYIDSVKSNLRAQLQGIERKDSN